MMGHCAKALWKQMNARVLALLNDLDAHGIEPGEPGGAPADEYDLEAEAIDRHLIKDSEIDRATVDEIWRYWFEETLKNTVGEKDAKQFVDDLNALTTNRDTYQGT